MICLVRSHSGSFADVRSKTGWILFSTRRLVSLAMMAFERDSSIVASVAEVPFLGTGIILLLDHWFDFSPFMRRLLAMSSMISSRSHHLMTSGEML